MKKLMATLTLALGMNCLAATTTYTYVDGAKSWSYTVSSSKATLVGVTGSLDGELVIPSKVGEGTQYPVVAIAANSFQSLAITSLKIVDSVTTIGAGAFANCTSLKTVDMGNGVVTIAHGQASMSGKGANTSNPDSYRLSGAFGGCINLEEVSFSSRLTLIGSHAFSECLALKAVELPDSLQAIGVNCFYHNTSLGSAKFGTDLVSIGTYSFYNCPELQTVEFKANETPLLTIGEYAFANDVKLTKLSFSNSLKQLYGGAFYGCTALTDLVLPDSLTYIGNAAFANCTSLKAVDMGDGVVTIASGQPNMSVNGANTKDPDSYYLSGAFGGCINLESVIFSSQLITIGAHAFSECYALKAVELPDSLQTIGVNCFYHNTSLASAKFGTDLVSIGTYSFYNCPELQTVEFKANETPLLTIGTYAFANDVKLTALSFSSSLKQLSEGAFYGCTALTDLVLPDSLTYIGNAAFANCTSLKTVDMGDGVVTIAHGQANMSGKGANTSNPDSYRLSGAFGGCINLEEVSFSSRLTLIGSHAFSECLALKAVELPDALQTIGVNCFYHNTSLGSVKFGTDLVSIGTYSFRNCPELQSVEFAANETPLLTIGEYAFANDVKLTKLSFSNSLKQLCGGAFYGCTALTDLVLPDSLTYIGNAAFANCTSLKTVDMGNGVVTIAHGEPNMSVNGANTKDPDSYYQSGAFGGCINLQSVIFSSRLTLIGSHAFSECYALKTVELPESLLDIGVNCFYHNKELTSVSFGKRIETIGTYSFYNCPALRYVTFAETTTPLLSIAKGAFANDISLATVTLSGGLKSVASGAFANDPLLRKLTIPSIVTEIGNNVFSGMGNLNEVTFLGLPPANIANAGLAKNVEIRYSKEWAEDWAPIIASCGFTNTKEFDPGTGGGGGSITGDVKLVVSNIVVHYVTQSIPSGAVIPPTSASIVNVITEVNAGNAIAITADWAKQYPGFEELYGNDFGKAVTAQTGKRDGAGNPMFVWQDFVVGTDPTNPEDTFKASITFDKETGHPIISWTPELSAAEAAKREYKVYGKVRINDKDWTEIKGNEGDFNFFKVSVGMK